MARISVFRISPIRISKGAAHVNAASAFHRPLSDVLQDVGFRANGSSRPSVDYRHRIFPFCQSLFIIFDMSDEIANNLYLVGILIRDLHTGKFIFHQYHQLQTTEPVDAEIVTKVRFIYNSFGINTQITANKGAYFVSILTFLFQAWLSCAQAAESHSDLLIRC
jgi:hypothetical protein